MTGLYFWSGMSPPVRASNVSIAPGKCFRHDLTLEYRRQPISSRSAADFMTRSMIHFPVFDPVRLVQRSSMAFFPSSNILKKPQQPHWMTWVDGTFWSTKTAVNVPRLERSRKTFLSVSFWKQFAWSINSVATIVMSFNRIERMVWY